MSDALEQVLRLVSEGRLTAAEAGPILDALGAEGLDDAGESSIPPADDAERPTASGSASSLRIEVTEAGRKVVNLRIPVPLSRLALNRIPGLSDDSADLVRRALADGRIGTLLVVDDDDGDRVRIALE